MNEQLLRLAARIRKEFVELAVVMDRAQEGWWRSQSSADDLYLDSVALNLHGFYAGLERLFELIAAAIDGTIPQGEGWHKTLLNQMTAEIPNVRPAVISEETRAMLNGYRKFRHIVRNVYTFKFDPAGIQKLVERLPELFTQVRAELLAFADFLVQQAQIDDEAAG